MTINDTVISGNQGGDACCGGGGGGAGIYNHNSGTLTLNRSAVLNNKLVGGFSGSGINSTGNVNVILNNSTISGNLGGEGIYVFTGTITINSSTIFKNQYEGIVNIAGDVNLQNTILAGNGGKGDCYNDATYQGSIISSGYNLIGNGDKCGIMPATGDKIGMASNPIDPKLSQYPILPIGFHILAPDSPAIDSANPGACPSTDQRGITRPQGGGCDIGSYEHGAIAGSATTIGVYSGTDQTSYFGRPFSNQLAVYVLDANGTPVNGVNVTFSAPTNGPSGTFASAKNVIQNQPQLDFARLNIGGVSSLPIYEATVKTVDGIAYAPVFKSNFQEGSYTVKATVPTLGLSTTFTLNNLPLNSSSNYLQNGDFEDPVIGNYWNGFSSGFGDPFCTLETCGNGGGTAGPLSGSTWVWFGGMPAPYTEQGEIIQYSVVIPKGPAHLRFYLWIGYADPDSNANDKLTVTFSHQGNDFVIFTANATQQSLYTRYTLVDIDLSQYADNETHYIKIAAITNGKLVNFNLDDISINDSIFTDVPPNYWARQYVERLYSAGITGGCTTTPLTYCPQNSVTRAQMAVFLLKGIHGSSFAPPAVGGSTGFNDVATTHWASAWIKQLAAESITGGCGNGNYCPENTVTRAQMAVFLLKAMHGSSYSPPNVTATFGDTAGHWAEDWIEQLAVEGITSGCGNGNYCPENPVTRDQMAVFLVKAFNLP